MKRTLHIIQYRVLKVLGKVENSVGCVDGIYIDFKTECSTHYKYVEDLYENQYSVTCVNHHASGAYGESGKTGSKGQKELQARRNLLHFLSKHRKQFKPGSWDKI